MVVNTWDMYGVNTWGMYGVNTWGMYVVNTWGMYGVNTWGMYGVNTWDMYGVNTWGMYGVNTWDMYGVNTCGMYGVNLVSFMETLVSKGDFCQNWSPFLVTFLAMYGLLNNKFQSNKNVLFCKRQLKHKVVYKKYVKSHYTMGFPRTKLTNNVFLFQDFSIKRHMPCLKLSSYTTFSNV